MSDCVFNIISVIVLYSGEWTCMYNVLLDFHQCYNKRTFTVTNSTKKVEGTDLRSDHTLLGVRSCCLTSTKLFDDERVKSMSCILQFICDQNLKEKS